MPKPVDFTQPATFHIKGTPIDWDKIAPPSPLLTLSDTTKRRLTEQYESESDADYVRRLWQEQN